MSFKDVLGAWIEAEHVLFQASAWEEKAFQSIFEHFPLQEMKAYPFQLNGRAFSLEVWICKSLDTPAQHFLVQLKDREQLCTYGIFLELLGEAELLRLGTLPAYQGQGLALGLLKEVQRLFSFEQLYLEVRASNIKAQKLYEKYGFEIQGGRKNYYENPKEDAKLYLWSKEKPCKSE